MTDVSWGRHSYFDTSKLNAKWDQALPAVAGLGDVGSLSGNSLGILGPNPFVPGAFPVYLWNQYSADTLALQKQTNEALSANGYKPIAENGTLDAPTCGAIRTMCGLVTVGTGGSCDPPATCQAYVDPVPVGTLVVHAGMMGGGKKNWILIGAGVGLAAVGVALVTKKRRGH